MKKTAQMARKPIKKESVNARQKAFLKYLLADEVKFSITEAANLAKVGRRTVYNWLQTDEKFKAVFEDAQESRFDKIEATMHSKAVDEKDTTPSSGTSINENTNRPRQPGLTDHRNGLM